MNTTPLKFWIGKLLRIAIVAVVVFTNVGAAPPQSVPFQSPAANLTGRKVTLDPGHSWSDSGPGAVANGMTEKDLTLDIALRVKPLLEAYGIEVTMTRASDESDLPLSTAAERANQFQADLVVAIHVNGGANGGLGGTESCYTVGKTTSGASQLLGSLLSAEVSRQLNLRHRGDFPENHLERCARMRTTGRTQLYIHDMDPPAAIIETAFIDGPLDDDVLKLRERRQDFAQAISDAVVRYFQGSQTSSSNTSTVLLIDISGSMGDAWQGGVKIESAKSAANQLVNVLEQESFASGVTHRTGLVSFSSEAYINHGLTTDYDQIRSAINSMQPLSQTNIGDGIVKANQVLGSAQPTEEKILILLSDGMSNAGITREEILAGPVQDAANAGTCIYTVGFGDPGNLDEDLLQQIALRSGCGTYYYATDVSALERIYIRIRHEAAGNILGEFQGVVGQNETVRAGEVNVPEGQSELTVSLHWPGSRLDLRLRDPNGVQVDENYPGATIVTYARLVYAIILQPVPGQWLVEVFGADVPQAAEAFDITLSSRHAPATPTPLPPTPLPTPVPLPEPQSGFPVMLLLLVMGGGGVGLYVYAGVLRRKRKSALADPSATGTASLHFTKGSMVGQMIPLGTGPVSIGRGPANKIQLKDLSASRLHATVQHARGQWFIQDQGSKLGTFVNNRKIQATALKNGDRVQIGSTEFVIRIKSG